jgi:hypothetical protein
MSKDGMVNCIELSNPTRSLLWDVRGSVWSPKNQSLYFLSQDYRKDPEFGGFGVVLCVADLSNKTLTPVAIDLCAFGGKAMAHRTVAGFTTQ